MQEKGVCGVCVMSSLVINSISKVQLEDKLAKRINNHISMLHSAGREVCVSLSTLPHFESHVHAAT